MSTQSFAAGQFGMTFVVMLQFVGALNHGLSDSQKS